MDATDPHGFDAGGITPSVDFQFPEDAEAEPAELQAAQRDNYEQGLRLRYRDGCKDALPAVLAALVDGHRERDPIITRLAGALWKAGLMPLAAAAKLARKSTRQIRRAGEDFKFSMSLAHDRKS